MASKKTYFPQKTFDDDLDAFVQLATSSQWVFTGVDFEQLQRDAVAQRTERAAFDAAELDYSRVREEFGSAQESRYLRFADALNAARGAFRRDKALLAQLERFRRSSKRATKSEA